MNTLNDQPHFRIGSLPRRSEAWWYSIEAGFPNGDTIRRDFAINGDNFYRAGASRLEALATVLEQAAKNLKMLAIMFRKAPPHGWSP